MRIPPLLTTALAGGLLAVGGVSGCGGGDETTASPAKQDTAGGGQTIDVKTFQFSPDPVTVDTGTKVTFKNADATIHTVVGGTREQPDKGDLDGSMAQDETYEVTLSEPGTYKYFCDRHSGPGMTAEIVVK